VEGPSFKLLGLVEKDGLEEPPEGEVPLRRMKRAGLGLHPPVQPDNLSYQGDFICSPIL
jgi:hypothetical protein